MKRSEERQSRFDSIRQHLAKESLDSGGFYKPKIGKNILRILPEVGEMEFFYVSVGQHFISRSNRHFCPSFTFGDPCPICEFVSQLYTAGDDASVELARKLGVRKQYWMNVIDRNNEIAGPQVWTPGPMIFKQIAAIVMDPQYGDLLIDEEDGLDIVVERSGSGLQTSYNVLAKRETTPLANDVAIIDQWMNTAMDLTPVQLTDDPGEDYELSHDEQGNAIAIVTVETYDRIKEAFEGIDQSSLSEDDSDDDEEPEDKVASVINQRRGRRGRR